MRGGTASLFCYGYTGAGKTHTVFGVESDVGMYRRTAEHLLAQIEAHNRTLAESEQALQLHVTVTEIYLDDVFDLLGDRKQCTLRINSKGHLMVRGPTQKVMLDADEAAEKGVEYIVVTEGLKTMLIRSSADLAEIYSISKQHRAVGSSTEHDQSSRSHAVFRMEIVNDRILELEKGIDEAEAIKPWLQSQLSKTREPALKKRVQELEASIATADRELEEIRSSGSALGGRLLLVDLAGADSDDRDLGEGHSLQQRKESVAINKSLLALKECLRGLHAQAKSGVQKRLPFRDSNITRLLEEAIVPRSGSDSDTVMIVNVAPPSHLEKKTVNSLRYGQLYATGLR